MAKDRGLEGVGTTGKGSWRVRIGFLLLMGFVFKGRVSFCSPS